MDACAALGASARGDRLERMERSPHYRDGKFHNTHPQQDDLWTMLKKWVRGSDAVTAPTGEVPVVARTAADFDPAPASGLRITWLGHSTALIEIDGRRFLTDPQWSRRNSPVQWIGPVRFFPSPLPLDELPALDAVIVSHDHHDHLDPAAVEVLNAREVPFVVPLGVGAHLELWGVPRSRITELDWGEQTAVNGIAVHCTESRHFSGRGLLDRDATLWAGFALVGPRHRVYYSGDTALFPELAEIGARLGPFDATLIEIGAYDATWADYHLGPEQAVRAHQLVRGGLLVPVHWGTFDLAMHGWTEPAERVLVAAQQAGVRLALPRPGQPVEPASPPALARWWPELPWQTAEEHPVISSGLDSAPAAAGTGVLTGEVR